VQWLGDHSRAQHVGDRDLAALAHDRVGVQRGVVAIDHRDLRQILARDLELRQISQRT